VNIKTLKWAKLISYIAGGGMGGVFIFLALVWKTQSPLVLAAGGALIALAGALGVLFPAPAQQVVANAPIVTLAGDKTGATTVTTDSTEPISAPQKGANV
jgi:hypothetical protein